MSMDNRPKDTAGWLLITAGILSMAVLLICGCSRKTTESVTHSVSDIQTRDTLSVHRTAHRYNMTDTGSLRDIRFTLSENWTFTDCTGDTVGQLVHNAVAAVTDSLHTNTASYGKKEDTLSSSHIAGAARSDETETSIASYGPDSHQLEERGYGWLSTVGKFMAGVCVVSGVYLWARLRNTYNR